MDEYTNQNQEPESGLTSQEQHNTQTDPEPQSNQGKQNYGWENAQNPQNSAWQSGQDSQKYGWQNSQNQQNSGWQNGQNQQNSEWQNGQNQQNSGWQNGQSQQNSAWQNGQTPQNYAWQNDQYQQPQTKQSNGMALASMIVGIFALLSCCIPFIQFPLAVIDIVLVILSKKGKPFHGFAIAGLVLGIISILISIGMTIYWGAVITMMKDPEFMSMYNEILEMYQ